MSHSESLQAHYNRVMPAVRALGFAEPISLAPNWQGRVDALYDQAKALSGTPEVGCVCWPGSPGMLADGRMACLVETRNDDGQKVTLFAITE